MGTEYTEYQRLALHAAEILVQETPGWSLTHSGAGRNLVLDYEIRQGRLSHPLRIIVSPKDDDEGGLSCEEEGYASQLRGEMRRLEASSGLRLA